MLIEKTERTKKLLRDLEVLEMALTTAAGKEVQMLEELRDAVLAKIRSGNSDSQIAA